MGKPFKTNVDITVAIDSDEIVEWVQKHYFPQDVYPREELDLWATENGYIKKEEA